VGLFDDFQSEMTLSSPTSYDLVVYPSNAFPQTHPDRLAVVATLLGLDPPPVVHCRVLEVGCAGGGNVIPMAAGLPGSRFLGIDNAPGPIAAGRRVIAGLGLQNIELRTASILDVDESYGQFDYIISHGIYSWVPAHVRHKLLEIYRDRLAPQGIGYISYNALPGWHLRGMLRDMMLYHVGRFAEAGPQTQIAQARALVDFLIRGVPEENNAYGMHLRREQDIIKQTADGHFYHDHLESENNAFYLFQFCAHLKAKGLRYAGEARFSDMGALQITPEAARACRNLVNAGMPISNHSVLLAGVNADR
jgi:SAM-dependent methyltransferase